MFNNRKAIKKPMSKKAKVWPVMRAMVAAISLAAGLFVVTCIVGFLNFCEFMQYTEWFCFGNKKITNRHCLNGMVVLITR